MLRRNFIVAAVGLPTAALSSAWSTFREGLRRLTAKTGSMLPAVAIDSTLVVDTRWYQTHAVQRFDIVALTRRSPRYPGGEPIAEQLVARVIGLPGETISLRNNVVYVNERALKEPMQTVPCEGEEGAFPCGRVEPTRIPPCEYYLLADNRGGSEDSRLWRPATVPAVDITGKVIEIIAPA